MELKEQVDSMQKDLAQLTQLMADKAKQDYSSEVKELGVKVAEIQNDLREKKIQFATASTSPIVTNKKELATRMDELFIAKYLCTDKETGKLDTRSWGKVKEVYADTIKAWGDPDPNTTATADNFIPVGFSAQFNEEIFLALKVAGIFGRINMPASDYKLPFAPGRLIATAGTEGGTVGKSKPGDERIAFAAKKLMSIVELTDELEQDSIIPVLNLFRKQLIDGFALAQDTMALNGDKATLGAGGNTPVIYDAALASTDCRSLVNGVRADAFAKGLKIDASTGKCCVANIRKMRAAMGKYGVSPSDLVALISIADYMNILNETGVQSLYQYGANAVLVTGELGRVDGIPLVVTELQPDRSNNADAADAPGGVLATGVCDIGTTASNDYSTFTLVNKNGFMFGDRKEFSLELWRNPLNQTTNLIGAQRIDFQKVTGASSTPAAIAINYAN